METSIQSTLKSAYAEKEITHRVSSFWQSAERNRFGIIPILVAVIGCSGGLSAAFGAHADIIRLAMVAFPAMVSLALTLALAPMKVIIYVSVIALVLDLTVLIF